MSARICARMHSALLFAHASTLTQAAIVGSMMWVSMQKAKADLSNRWCSWIGLAALYLVRGMQRHVCSCKRVQVACYENTAPSTLAVRMQDCSTDR